jgi:hypothetical protein
MHTDFTPDPLRVQYFDSLIRSRLADSLRYLREQLGDRIELDDTAFHARLESIELESVTPDTFAHYYAAVIAAASGHYEVANECLREITFSTSAGDEIEFFGFKDPRKDLRSRCYFDIFNSNPDTDFPIRPITDEQKSQTAQLVAQALEILEAGDKNLSQEIRALIRVILLGEGPNKKGELTFDGASAFELWGLIALNVLRASNRVEMAEILAHESCHALLFGFCIDGKLVLNPDDDRHASPLREDPRPIDGVFHATFVLARMYHALRVMKDSGLLSGEERAEVETRQKKRISAFLDGLNVLRAHAQYTAEGGALIRSAEEYMQTHVAGLKKA